jgi:hypothetical protein
MDDSGVADGSLLTVGWREWLALPVLGVSYLKAKVDTGARTSALHVEWHEVTTERGAPWVRFALLSSSTARLEQACEAAILDRRQVTDSGGHRTERVFIETEVALGGRRWRIETNLTNRRGMLFPMLLGRTAMAGRLLVDPARSYVLGEPDSTEVP